MFMRVLILAGLFLFSSTAFADMQLVMLGTGTPNAVPDRSGPALAIIHNGNAYLVDAGPGVARRAAAAERKGVQALAQPNLQYLFLTHLHSDHTLGLPDLIFTPWVLERSAPLSLFGPKGSADMVEHLHMAYQADIEMRLNGLEPANASGYQVKVTEIGDTPLLLQKGGLTVSAIPVLHGGWKQAYGFKFEADGQTIVISGDARPSPALIAAARGADILVHEVYSDSGFRAREPVWQAYHQKFHTSASELAAIALQTRPTLLVLTHQLYWGASDETLIQEIRDAGYHGPLASSRDLDIFTP